MCQTRHTFASLMISPDEDINWVARMMGDRVETVLGHYHRYQPDKERRDGTRFLERYGGEQKPSRPKIEKFEKPGLADFQGFRT